MKGIAIHLTPSSQIIALPSKTDGYRLFAVDVELPIELHTEVKASIVEEII